MSLRATRAVREHSRSRGATRLVLLDLADRAQNDGIAWPREGRTREKDGIADTTWLSESTVRRAIRDGETLGEVETRTFLRGRTRRNVYRLLLLGLDGPNYERLAKENVFPTEPFSTGQVDRPFGRDDQSFCGATTGQDDRSRARDQFPASTSKNNRKLSTYSFSGRIVAIFNKLADTDLDPQDWVKVIAKRVLEYPDLTLDDHVAVIEHALKHPWWEDVTDARVVYGNGMVFEQAVEALRDAEARGAE